MHLRSVGEKPSAADSLGINVYGIRYLYTFIGGCLSGLGGASLSIAISSGWYSSMTTSGQGWIAIALVIFARWNPVPAALGGYLFGMLRRFTLDLQGPVSILGFRNPFFYDHNLVFFLQMTPFLLTILALWWGSGAAKRKRKTINQDNINKIGGIPTMAVNGFVYSSLIINEPPQPHGLAVMISSPFCRNPW
jgi:simple sugar transport system permease protein